MKVFSEDIINSLEKMTMIESLTTNRTTADAMLEALDDNSSNKFSTVEELMKHLNEE